MRVGYSIHVEVVGFVAVDIAHSHLGSSGDDVRPVGSYAVPSSYRTPDKTHRQVGWDFRIPGIFEVGRGGRGYDDIHPHFHHVVAPPVDYHRLVPQMTRWRSAPTICRRRDFFRAHIPQAHDNTLCDEAHHK